MPTKAESQEAAGGWWGTSWDKRPGTPCNEMTVLPPARKREAAGPGQATPFSPRVTAMWASLGASRAGVLGSSPQPVLAEGTKCFTVRLVSPPRAAQLPMWLCQDAQRPVVQGRRMCRGPSGRRARGGWVASTCVQDQPEFRPTVPKGARRTRAPHSEVPCGQYGGGWQ